MEKKQSIAVIGPNPIQSNPQSFLKILTQSNPIQSNPIHGWIQSMSNSDLAMKYRTNDVKSMAMKYPPIADNSMHPIRSTRTLTPHRSGRPVLERYQKGLGGERARPLP